MNPTQSFPQPLTQHMPSLRQTHRVATSLLPLLTASLTVAGAVIAALETREMRAPQAAPTTTNLAADGQPDVQGTRAQTPAMRPAVRPVARGGVSARRYLATLIGRVLLVALGATLVLALVYATFATGQVGRAIVLTALVLLTLYLTEKVARR